MKCLNQSCNATEIETDDNFCYQCGCYTGKGYRLLQDENNVNKIINGNTYKQRSKLNILITLLLIAILIFLLMISIRGESLFKPFNYLKKESLNYIYGFKTTLLNTENKYNKETIDSKEDALSIIKKDTEDQDYYCFNDIEVSVVAHTIEEDYGISSVSFCDMSLKEANSIKEVIDKMYILFPNIKGALTNITISNAKTTNEYIARFQPMYQFVNIDEDINLYNKVNKTQILLNSYYFLNKDILNKNVEDVVGTNFYVENATWYSTIAHELGHYISFVTLLKDNNINDITLVTKDNYELINNIIDEYEKGTHSKEILEASLLNYNNKYNTNLTLEEFASSISKYASIKDNDNNIIYDETIAEAIHDYYINNDNLKDTSREIINIINENLRG